MLQAWLYSRFIEEKNVISAASRRDAEKTRPLRARLCFAVCGPGAVNRPTQKPPYSKQVSKPAKASKRKRKQGQANKQASKQASK
jgi:hypothetical protein